MSANEEIDCLWAALINALPPQGNAAQLTTSHAGVCAPTAFAPVHEAVSNRDAADEICRKPSLSYRALLTEALQSAGSNGFTLREIYEWIQKKYPYYHSTNRHCTASWRSSIRHNLVSCAEFTRRCQATKQSPCTDHSHVWDECDTSLERTIGKRRGSKHCGGAWNRSTRWILRTEIVGLKSENLTSTQMVSHMQATESICSASWDSTLESCKSKNAPMPSSSYIVSQLDDVLDSEWLTIVSPKAEQSGSTDMLPSLSKEPSSFHTASIDIAEYVPRYAHAKSMDTLMLPTPPSSISSHTLTPVASFNNPGNDQYLTIERRRSYIDSPYRDAAHFVESDQEMLNLASRLTPISPNNIPQRHRAVSVPNFLQSGSMDLDNALAMLFASSAQ